MTTPDLLAMRMSVGKIYGWFTNECDAKDLQEAKALLNELV
jgi:hypothetical protein